MAPSRAAIAHERRRQMQIRKAFDVGLNPAAAWNGRDPGAFYLACADYLLFSMDRLHEQDQIIHDLLAQRIAPAEVDAHQRLRVLNERQNQSRALVARFKQTAEGLRIAGARGIAAFEAGAREFTENFKALLQPRRNPFFQHTDRLFTDADWTRIAGVTAQSIDTEKRLFAAVQKTAPTGVDPERMSAEHLAPG